MNITYTEWFLIGTNMLTAFIMYGLYRDARKTCDMLSFTIMKIADGELTVKRVGTNFLIKHKENGNGS